MVSLASNAPKNEHLGGAGKDTTRTQLEKLDPVRIEPMMANSTSDLDISKCKPQIFLVNTCAYIKL